MTEHNTSADDVKQQIDKVFNKLRARLFNMIEQMQIEPDRINAYKQTIRDITGDGWNSVAELMTKKKEGK